MFKHKSLTVLILCYACRVETSITVLWESPPTADWNRCRDTQSNTVGSSGLLWKSWRRTKDPKSARNSTDQKIQLGWALGSSERLRYTLNQIVNWQTAPRTLEHRKQIYSSVWMWVSQHLEQNPFLKLLPVPGICSPTGLPLYSLWERMSLIFKRLYSRLQWYSAHPHTLIGERVWRMEEGILCCGDQESGSRN